MNLENLQYVDQWELIYMMCSQFSQDSVPQRFNSVPPPMAQIVGKPTTFPSAGKMANLEIPSHLEMK